MGDACQPTYAVTPIIDLKNEARSCLSSLSLRNVIMCDNNTSLAENKYRILNRLSSSYGYYVVEQATKHYKCHGYLYVIYTLQ